MEPRDDPTGQAVAAAAAQLLGTRFRLHGRNPATGLDCVGLAACALEQAGVTIEVPQGYHLRNASISDHLHAAELSPLKQATPPVRSGDVVLVQPGPAQYHLLVAESERTFIHAHASLRRVVRATGDLPWPIEMIWRLVSKC